MFYKTKVKQSSTDNAIIKTKGEKTLYLIQSYQNDSLFKTGLERKVLQILNPCAKLDEFRT